ncbi:hypothetical protein ElyMa_001160100 [Elysia marginata]|uniref:Uncharacterized protein n=1 Tax=Elysia marginata TaxID=1093978 RepID=A0AAV4I1M6_9GAST|nr:hypothetical protein ElyMa_001160100 [Elysia marginata]
MWTTVKLISSLVIILAAFLHWTAGDSIDETIVLAANTSREFEFFYDESHHLIKVELDMVFTMEEWAEIQRLNATGWDTEGPAKRTAGIISGRGGGTYWRGNTVPYEYAGGFCEWPA